jgi:hypothetical protein
MAAKFVTRKDSFGQVEPNRLTGITFGNIEAQAPAYEDLAAENPIPALENGQFLCVVADLSDTSPLGRISVLPGVASASSTPYLVFSEKKIYDERHGYADFIDLAKDKVDGLLYPRLIGITPDSCVFTTNTLNEDNTEDGGDVIVGDTLFIGDDGYLSKTAGTNEVYQFSVVKVYTMPDGQEAVKVMAQRFGA